MKIYALYDEENKGAGPLAYLECYEEDRSFYFELPPEADPWNLPFILHEFVRRGMYTVDAQWSATWVRSRLVPPERQNLGEVLRENGLDEYDELRLLELTEGRCAQDACYLEPVARGQLSSWYSERLCDRLLDVCPLGGFRLLLAYRDGSTMLCKAVDTLAGRRQFARVVSEPEVFGRAVLQAGGHGVRWGDALQLSAEELRATSTALPLTATDLASVAGTMVCDTAEAAQLLGCTRQNVSDLVRRGRLAPVKSGRHMALFLRSDLHAYRMGQA